MERIEVPELGKLRDKIEEYVAKLPLEEQEKIRKKADKIAIKHYLKSGVPVVCVRCNKGGAGKETGPLMKMKDGSDKYCHKNCLVIRA